MTTRQSITSEATEAQVRQLMRFLEDAMYRLVSQGRLGKAEAQRLIEHGDRLKGRMIAVIQELLMAKYPAGYAVKGIEDQVNILHQLFPTLGDADLNLAGQPLPSGAEGWFAIPFWPHVAPTYNEAVRIVLGLIERQREGSLYDFGLREGRLGEQYLRQHEHKVRMMQALGEEQDYCEILVVPAQFGLRHWSRSPNAAREAFTAKEFGLGVFEVGCMLLTHPERLTTQDDLWIYCVGDEHSLAGNDKFTNVPVFYADNGCLMLAMGGASHTSQYYGVASGFLP